MERVAIYCRVSTDEQNDSIQNQQSLLINYCKQNNLQYDLYVDEGYTGTNINRPKFLELMEKCSLVYVDKYDIERLDGTQNVKVLTKSLIDRIQL